MTGSTQCPHNDVHYNLNLAAFGDTNLRYLEITGRCKICNAPLRFRGPMGVAPDVAKISVDRETLHAPLLFGDEQLTGSPVGYGIDLGVIGGDRA